QKHPSCTIKNIIEEQKTKETEATSLQVDKNKNLFEVDNISLSNNQIEDNQTRDNSLYDTYMNINNKINDENIQCFKYIRDYKSSAFAINENDSLSYVLGVSKKKKLAFIFPTISKKIVFSKTGQQKRKNYLYLKE
ncbi:conserved protein, unknown function, partial [Hepatocystis sp. ex Piliocolobus tephrosceles]